MRTVRSPIRDSYNGQKAGEYMTEIERIKKEVLHVTLVCESLTDGMERKRIKVKK